MQMFDRAIRAELLRELIQSYWGCQGSRIELVFISVRYDIGLIMAVVGWSLRHGRERRCLGLMAHRPLRMR